MVNTEFQKRNKARNLVTAAIRTGKLVRGSCEVCGLDLVEGHHDDYDKPLEVRWLCHLHHMEQHSGKKRRATAEALNIRNVGTDLILQMKLRAIDKGISLRAWVIATLVEAMEKTPRVPRGEYVSPGPEIPEETEEEEIPESTTYGPLEDD